MSLLKLLSKIDQRTKDSVNGWIRMKEKALRLHSVPSLINAICILYFRNDDIFAFNGNSLKVTKDNKCIVWTKHAPEGGLYIPHEFLYTAYGYNQVSPCDNVKYRWDIKVKGLSEDR